MTNYEIEITEPRVDLIKNYFKAFENKGAGQQGFDINQLSFFEKKFSFVPSVGKKIIDKFSEFNKNNNREVLWGYSKKNKEIAAEIRIGKKTGKYLNDENSSNEPKSVLSPTIIMSSKNKTKEAFESTFISMVSHFNKKKVPEFLINAPLKNKTLNQYFFTMCKFCKGKAFKFKDRIEYLIPANLEKIKQAFKEITLLSSIKAKQSINGIASELKNLTKPRNNEKQNKSIIGDLREKLFGNKSKNEEIIEKPKIATNDKLIGYDAKAIMEIRRNLRRVK